MTGLEFAHPDKSVQHKVTAQIGSTQITIETGKIAKLADELFIMPAQAWLVHQVYNRLHAPSAGSGDSITKRPIVS